MDEADFSSMVAQVQKMLSENDGENGLQNLLGMLSGGNSSDADSKGEAASADDNPQNSAPPQNTSEEAQMLLKMQKLMSLMNSPPSTETSFLNSLKPFLKPERRAKVEQAVKLMSMGRAFKLFKETEKGGF